MGYGDLFSLAKIISNSPYGLVGYYMARLNKSPYPISPHRININYLKLSYAINLHIRFLLSDSCYPMASH